MLKNISLLTALAFSVMPLGAAFAAPQAPWTVVKSVPFPDVKSGPYSDYLYTDTAKHRVFTTMQANKEVVVTDYDSGQIVKIIPGFGNPHGVIYIPKINSLYVSDGSGKVETYDGTTYEHLKTIKLRDGVDGMILDPINQSRLYVADGGEEVGEKTAHLSIINTGSDEVSGDIEFEGGMLEQGSIDAVTDRLYINLPMESRVAVVDLKTDKVLSYLPLEGCDKNMSIAAVHDWNRLFVACRNGSMRGVIDVMDLASGKVLKVLPSRGWIDSLWVDLKRHTIFDSSGNGMVETYKYDGHNGYAKLPDVDTGMMAKTSYFDPAADRLFVSVPHLGFPTDYANAMVLKPAL